jgi:hypothetical protein
LGCRVDKIDQKHHNEDKDSDHQSMFKDREDCHCIVSSSLTILSEKPTLFQNKSRITLTGRLQEFPLLYLLVFHMHDDKVGRPPEVG